MITLEQLLESRDRRAGHQQRLLEAHPGRVLLCFTVQLPGSVKRNGISMSVADAGVKAIRELFEPEYEELLDLETGYEGYFLLAGNPLEIKRQTCHVEDTHPLGRLMDIDVLPQARQMPVSREDIGLGPRGCLLCGQPARVCMRAQTHTQAELLAKIEEMLNSYLKL